MLVYNKLLEDVSKYNELFSIKEKELLYEIYDTIYNKIININTFKNKIKFLFKKNIISFDNESISIFKKIYPHFKKDYNISDNEEDYNFIINLLEKINEIFKIKDSFSLFPIKKEFNTISINYEDILTEEEIVYFLLNYIYMENKEENLSILKKLKTKEKLSIKELETLKEIYPIHVSNIAHLNNYIPIEYKYYMTLVDESLLVPNYLTYSILARTSYVSLTGDVSQMSFYHLLPKNALNTQIEFLYGKLKKDFSMYLNIINGKVNSFYDILSYNKSFINKQININILNDNFRYPYNIFKTLCLLSEEYNSYQKTINSNEEIKNVLKNKDNFFNWKYNNKIKKYQNDLFFIESLVNNKQQNYIDIFENIKEFLKINKKRNITIAIITSFSSDKEYLMNMINNLKTTKKEIFNYIENDKVIKIYKDIEILCAYEVQGMEFDIVIYDTFLDKGLQEYSEILSSKPQIFNVAISRTKELFFLIGNIKEFKDIESSIHKNIRYVVNNNFTII